MHTILLLLKLIDIYNHSPYHHIHYINNYVAYEDKCVLDLDDYIYDLGFKESSNRYQVVNKYGYMGRYQFSPKTLKNLGFSITQHAFLSNELLQDQAFIQLLLHNKQLLQHTIERYEGKVVNGVTITESGILAAAHLVGPYHVKRYLIHGVVKRDAFGTSVEDYLIQFSGYTLNII